MNVNIFTVSLFVVLFCAAPSFPSQHFCHVEDKVQEEEEEWLYEMNLGEEAEGL